MANSITWARVALVPAILAAGAFGQSRLAFACLVLAGASDVFDGYVARRTQTASTLGARLDTVADFMVLVAGAACLEVLYPRILLDNVPLLAVTAALYLPSLAT